MENATIRPTSRLFVDDNSNVWLMCLAGMSQSTFVNILNGHRWCEPFRTDDYAQHVAADWKEITDVEATVNFKVREATPSSETVRIANYDAVVTNTGVDVAGLHVPMEKAQELVHAIARFQA